MKKHFTTIDLFSGIGGIRIGFECTGSFQTIFANDFEEKCQHAYNLNFPDSPLVVEDIRNIKSAELPNFDVLLAGFPCQAFSIAGYREGFNDNRGRGNLFFEIERILNAKKPQAFLLENVKNLKTHDNCRTFNIILDKLSNLGYKVKYEVLNSMDYGNIPQNRERIYIVGFLNNDAYQQFDFPSKIQLNTNIADILEDLNQVDKKYFYNDKPLFQHIVKDIDSEKHVYQWRRKYVRKNQKNVFPTLTANMGMGGHNVPIVKQKDIIRKITPRECARVQGFPESYRIPTNIADCHLYKQFGNSVSIPIVERIANNMYMALRNALLKTTA